nr:transglycosylase SLT domain-containing protein [Streptomyces chartreusis]
MSSDVPSDVGYTPAAPVATVYAPGAPAVSSEGQYQQLSETADSCQMIEPCGTGEVDTADALQVTQEKYATANLNKGKDLVEQKKMMEEYKKAFSTPQDPYEQADMERAAQERLQSIKDKANELYWERMDRYAGQTSSDWLEEAIDVLKSYGYTDWQLDRGAIKLIIRSEGGPDPYAINDWDNNAKRGHPSIGPMQLVENTFDRWRVPGHGDIFNPVDNIIAGIRYGVAGWGTWSEVPGAVSIRNGEKYTGYDWPKNKPSQ